MNKPDKSFYESCEELFDLIELNRLYDLHDKYAKEPDDVRWRAAFDYAVFIDDIVGWEASIEWFKFAANRWMIEAQFPLGVALYYEAQYYENINVWESFYWLNLAFINGVEEAREFFAGVFPNDHSENELDDDACLLALMTLAGERGILESQIWLANYFQSIPNYSFFDARFCNVNRAISFARVLHLLNLDYKSQCAISRYAKPSTSATSIKRLSRVHN